jgi:hypothetical protein
MAKNFTVRTANEIWAAGIAILLIVYLCTVKVGSDQNVTNYLNFALALSSLLLSLVGIVMTLFGSSEIARNFADMREAGTSTRIAAETISRLNDELASHFNQLLAEVGSTKEITLGISGQIQNLNQNATLETGQAITSGSIQRFIEITSNFGLCALYAAKVSEMRTKPVNLLTASPDDAFYLFGFIVACQGLGLFQGTARDYVLNITSFPNISTVAIREQLEKNMIKQNPEQKDRDEFKNKIDGLLRNFDQQGDN